MSTTATFDQMSIQMDAKNTIYLKIKACCFELIDALNKDVLNAALAHTQKTSKRFTNENLADLEFVVDSQSETLHHLIMCKNKSTGESYIHCFIDKTTGAVYAVSPYQQPRRTKKILYNVTIIAQRIDMLARADWRGNYLRRR
tara:strand:+ start:35 stop:463 length:429 start_codon:yes stop_codon:yes gene_type:complete